MTPRHHHHRVTFLLIMPRTSTSFEQLPFPSLPFQDSLAPGVDDHVGAPRVLLGEGIEQGIALGETAACPAEGGRILCTTGPDAKDRNIGVKETPRNFIHHGGSQGTRLSRCQIACTVRDV